MIVLPLTDRPAEQPGQQQATAGAGPRISRMITDAQAR